MTHKLIKTDNYLLVVDDSEIKRGKWFYNPISNSTGINYSPDGCNKIIAHLPLNGSPILEGVDLLPPYSRHQEDGIEDAVMSFKESWIKLGVTDYELSAFSEGYNKAREKYKYTEEDVWKAIVISKSPNEYGDYLTINDIIQSLHQYPTEFECDMEQYYNEVGNDGFEFDSSSTIPPPRPKKITTAQGLQWVGKYK